MCRIGTREFLQVSTCEGFSSRLSSSFLCKEMPRHWIPVFAGMTTGRDIQVCNFHPTIVYAKYTVRTKAEIDDSACADIL